MSLPETQSVFVRAEGTVLGGGLGLACAVDVTIPHRDASFGIPGMPETGLGILPAQIAPFVVERIGLVPPRRMGVCGARFNGAEVTRLGLAHFAEANTDAVRQRLEEVLKQVLRYASRAIAETKKNILAVGKKPLADILDLATARFSIAQSGNEAGVGTRALIEERLPAWANIAFQGGSDA